MKLFIREVMWGILLKISCGEFSITATTIQTWSDIERDAQIHLSQEQKYHYILHKVTNQPNDLIYLYVTSFIT